MADAFFIPFSVTPFASLEERLYEQLEPRLRQSVAALARLLREQGWEGQRLYRDNRGVMWLESARNLTTRFDPASPDAPAVFNVHNGGYLTPDEAKALQLEFFRLWQRYQAAVGERLGRKYILQLAFVPSPSE